MAVMIFHPATCYWELDPESTTLHSLTEHDERIIVIVCSVESFLSR
jgi:hypothetical protein